MKNTTYRTGWQQSHSLLIGGLIMATAVLAVLDLFLGSVKVPLKSVFQIISGSYTGPEQWRIIITEFRVPRTLTALLAGAALSVSGLQMQTIFRNPLAGPYVLGISSGASLGVALLVLGFSGLIVSDAVFGAWALVVAATLGAGFLLLLILLVSVRIKNVMTILILGILFGSIATALVAILQYFSTESLLKSFIVWTMGSLGNVTPDQLRVFSITIITALIITILSTRLLNAMLLGEDYARTLGLNPKMIRSVIFISTSILAGSVTAFCGPIGFLGIVVPHLARMLFSTANHKILIPGSFLIGASLLLVSDVFSQLPGSDHILPINSVTALIGIPVIIWILIRRKEITAFS